MGVALLPRLQIVRNIARRHARLLPLAALRSCFVCRGRSSSLETTQRSYLHDGLQGLAGLTGRTGLTGLTGLTSTRRTTAGITCGCADLQQYLRSSCCMSLRIACFRLKQSFEADRWKAGCRTRVAEQRIFTHSIFRLTIYREVRARARCKHRLRRRCFTHVVFPPCDCASLRAVVEPVEHAPQRPVERWMF